MQLAFGMLYIAPSAFWCMVWPEFDAALRGFRRYGIAAMLGGAENSSRSKPNDEWTDEEIDHALDYFDLLSQNGQLREKASAGDWKKIKAARRDRQETIDDSLRFPAT